MSDWKTTTGRIIFGGLSVVAVVAAMASMSGTQRAQSLGLTRHGQTLTAQDAGAPDAVAVVAVAPGTAGQVYTISDAGLPHWAAVPTSSTGLTVTRYYADDFTAESGSRSASITGTDAAAAATLTWSTVTDYYGSGGAQCARLVLPLPAGVREVNVTVKITAATNLNTSGFRWLGIALRNAASGGAPTALWGIGIGDAGNYTPGNLLSGANGGTASLNGPNGVAYTTSGRYYRVTILPRLPRLGFVGAAGSTWPAAWVPPTQAVSEPLGASSTPVLPDTTTSTALAIWAQSFGGGAAGSVTLEATVDVVVGP